LIDRRGKGTNIPIAAFTINIFVNQMSHRRIRCGNAIFRRLFHASHFISQNGSVFFGQEALASKTLVGKADMEPITRGICAAILNILGVLWRKN